MGSNEGRNAMGNEALDDSVFMGYLGAFSGWAHICWLGRLEAYRIAVHDGCVCFPLCYGEVFL